MQLGGATPSTLQPRHESPGLRPVPKIENQHAWCAFLYAGEPICLRYPMRQTAQLFYRPDGYHGPSKTLGCSHSTEGGLHWRTVTLSRTSGVLFCRYCVLCIAFEITLVQEVKQPRCEPNGSPPSNDRIKNVRTHSSTHITFTNQNFVVSSTLISLAFCGATTQLGSKGPRSLGFLVHTIRHTHTHTHTHTDTPGRNPMNQLSARRRGRYLHNTQQTQETNIHALSGIRNSDPSNRAAAKLRIRSQGHWGRPSSFRSSKLKKVTWSENVRAYGYKDTA